MEVIKNYELENLGISLKQVYLQFGKRATIVMGQRKAFGLFTTTMGSCGCGEITKKEKQKDRDELDKYKTVSEVEEAGLAADLEITRKFAEKAKSLGEQIASVAREIPKVGLIEKLDTIMTVVVRVEGARG